MRKSLFYRLCELLNIISTLRFNFHYFGWKGLLIRPIVFYSPVKLRDMKGRIQFKCPMYHAIVCIGLPGNEMFPYDSLNIWSDQGGNIVFEGTFGTNPGSSFVIRNGANLYLGAHCSFGQNFKLLCSKEIYIGKELLASWNLTIMDTDSHSFINIETNQINEFSKSIMIGNHCFVGSDCSILKGSYIPNGSVIASRAVVTGILNLEQSVYAGVPAKNVKKGVAYYK